MKRIFVYLLVVFSLLVAPIAHASGLACQGDSCQFSEQTKKDSKGEKQDDEKLAKVGHHCCCAHTASDKPNYKSHDFVASVTKTFVTGEDENLASVVVGPPLEPPSHT
jgi:hypothetical protein